MQRRKSQVSNRSSSKKGKIPISLENSPKDVVNQNRAEETDLQPVSLAPGRSNRNFNPCRIC